MCECADNKSNQSKYTIMFTSDSNMHTENLHYTVSANVYANVKAHLEAVLHLIDEEDNLFMEGEEEFLRGLISHLESIGISAEE